MGVSFIDIVSKKFLITLLSYAELKHQYPVLSVGFNKKNIQGGWLGVLQ